MKNILNAHNQTRVALVFTAAISSVMMLQAAGPTWETSAPTPAQAYTFSAERDPATDVSDVYRAF